MTRNLGRSKWLAWWKIAIITQCWLVIVRKYVKGTIHVSLEFSSLIYQERQYLKRKFICALEQIREASKRVLYIRLKYIFFWLQNLSMYICEFQFYERKLFYC